MLRLLLLFVTVARAYIWPVGIFSNTTYELPPRIAFTGGGIYKITHCWFQDLTLIDGSSAGAAISIISKEAEIYTRKTIFENCTALVVDKVSDKPPPGYGGAMSVRGRIITVDWTSFYQCCSERKGSSLAILSDQGDNTVYNMSQVSIFQSDASWGEMFVRWAKMSGTYANWTDIYCNEDAGPIGAENDRGFTLTYIQMCNTSSGSGFHWRWGHANGTITLCNFIGMKLEQIKGYWDANILIRIDPDGTRQCWAIVNDCTIVNCTHHKVDKTNWLISKNVYIDNTRVMNISPEMNWTLAEQPCFVGNIIESDEQRDIPQVPEWYEMYSTREFTSIVETKLGVLKYKKSGIYLWPFMVSEL